MDVIEKIANSVHSYNDGRNNMTSDQIAELRAKLSCDMFDFSEIFRDADLDAGRTTIDVEKVEGEIFLELFNKYKDEGKSQSAAEVLARKLVKADSRYVGKAEENRKALAFVRYCDKISKMGTQVLNAMSYKS